MSKAKQLITVCNEAQMKFTDQAKILAKKLRVWAKRNNWTVETPALKDAFGSGHFILRKYTTTEPISEADLLDAKELWNVQREKQVYAKYNLKPSAGIQMLTDAINAKVKDELEIIEREAGDAGELIRNAGYPVNIEHMLGHMKGVIVSFNVRRNDVVKT